MNYLEFFKAPVYTAVFSLLATPFDFVLASAIGAIDIPKDSRRMHTSPIPRTGGISLFASFAVFSLIFCRDIAPDLVCLLSGAIFIVSLGIADDAFGLSAKTKLTVQAVAVIFTVSGVFIYREIGILWVAFGVLWLLVFINAHNFIDGLDGLCAGVSAIEAAALAVLFFTSENDALGFLAAIIGGACLGFFPYNAKNARIFMGDTGSTFLGFSLGLASLLFLLENKEVTAFISICLIFAVPLSDIAFAVSRRVYQGKSIFASDRSHIHHLLADSTLGHRNASLILRCISISVSVLGVVIHLVFS